MNTPPYHPDDHPYPPSLFEALPEPTPEPPPSEVQKLKNRAKSERNRRRKASARRYSSMKFKR